MSKPSRRQIVLNWLFGEDDLTKPDGWWGGSEAIAHVDQLLAALDTNLEATIQAERIKARLMGHEDRDPEIARLKRLLEEWRCSYKTLSYVTAEYLCKRTDDELREQ